MNANYDLLEVKHYPIRAFAKDICFMMPFYVARKAFIALPCFIGNKIYDKIWGIDAVKAEDQAIKSLVSKLAQYKVSFSYDGKNKILTEGSSVEFLGIEINAIHYDKKNCYQISLKNDVDSITDKIAITLNSLTGKNNITC